MKLSSAQLDRAIGVVVASAAGDALGAGYEFAPIPDGLVPEMIGGGLGNFEPGEWTDDTAQAMAIAAVAADGLDLRTPEALDRIAQGFADWYANGPADVGFQTAEVLRLAGRTPTGAEMAHAARRVHERRGRSAGNGSLMRTGPVALAHLDDPDALVEAAMAVSALTHHEVVAQEACAVWCLMIRHAVLHGTLPSWPDIEPWSPKPTYWGDVLSQAETLAPSAFTNNAWAVGALQAAWSAVHHTPVPAPNSCAHLVDALGTAIRIGNDTDTVAAIAGALIGARWGASAVPARWRRILHGWPGATAKGLEKVGHLAATRAEPGHHGWPMIDHIDYTGWQAGGTTLVRHPHDPGVWLSDATALSELPAEVDAVVSLCLVGRRQIPDHIESVGFRLIDMVDPTANPNLDFTIRDAAETIAALRAEGKTVLLHCVAAQSRTPTVGAAYSMLRGVDDDRALAEVCSALPRAHPNRAFRTALKRLADKEIRD
ncbi:ADP-ribosylglycohydrolase family protein [Nocardioides sp. zg-536]|uniref:ADP-ribosylglycohydrolase family protein n=1 Tax=Nocardioides faecalis TaxID=2803858 RepID=A0A938XYX6_9ACTN|nr:ADP-ribosylglycohydrolase family protein [Nocardioides faecalis]MBM9458761.1 ADP-ribosylglycohydrolase family protein [Nocardioides faecalis]QVI60179.1 ADP-ribosylglycohydrolase family protein [Nocardioides faecalis]